MRYFDPQHRWNEVHHGLTWTPTPGSTTIQAVTDYCHGFAWAGVSVREVCEKVHKDSSEVRKALKRLVEDGLLRVELVETRGPRASKKQVFYSYTDSPWATDGYPIEASNHAG